jgi:hopanoid biosynthesis associated protein HpnK
LHDAVNEGVRQAAVGGILTATSLMMAAPATAAAVRLAESLPKLRVGLHLVLVDGNCVLPPRLIPALVDSSGRFPNAMVLNSVRFVTSRKIRAQLAAEIRAQFEAFARTGLELDHVNAHKHFHLHPLVLELVLRIGREFGLSAVRIPQEPWWFSRRSGNVTGNAFLLPWLGRMRRRLLVEGVIINDSIFGVSCSGQLDTPRILDILARLPSGVTEIYSHPAVSAAGSIAESMKAYRHAEELRALTDPLVSMAVADSGAVCGGYRDLQHQH